MHNNMEEQKGRDGGMDAGSGGMSPQTDAASTLAPRVSVDLTAAFRKHVGTARRRSGRGGRTAAELMPSRRRPSQWTRRCREVLSNLTSLQALLKRHSYEYVGARQYGGGVGASDVGAMADSQRDELDRHAYQAVKDSSASIEALQKEAKEQAQVQGDGDGDSRGGGGSHASLHRDAVIASLFRRVQATAAMIKTLRRLRLKQAQATVQRLSTGIELRKPSAPPPEDGDGAAGSTAPEAASYANVVGMEWLSNDLQHMAQPDEDEALMFEEENVALAEELNAHADAALRLEQQIEEIGQMVAFFATKIHEQDQTIDVIHENSMDAQEHVRSGNMQLTQASQQSFFGRFNVLLFLIIASAALLFLDWYG